MPRPTEIPKWRRIAMQAIMWVVLAATVGLAAVVNRELRKTHGGELGDPITIAQDVTLRLPHHWVEADSDDDSITVREPGANAQMGRTIEVTVGAPASPFDFFRSLTDGENFGGNVQQMTVPVGAQTGTLLVRKRHLGEGFYQITVTVSAMISKNRKLTITLREINQGQKRVRGDTDLVKRVAASVKLGLAGETTE
jgi:hypothetical protein